MKYGKLLSELSAREWRAMEVGKFYSPVEVYAFGKI